MKKTLKIIIRDRVFSIADLKRIATVFDRQSKLARKSNHHASTEYEIQFSDNTSIETDSTEILDDAVLHRPGRPIAIRFSFHNFDLGRHLSFAISHGDSTYGNVASVTANDNSSWVNNNFVSLEEAIETARPQTFWFRRHPTVLLHLIALGVGSLIQLVLALATDGIFEATELSEVIKPLPDDSPWRSIVTKMSPLLYIALWVIRWFIGLWWALEIRSWLLSLWPHIELDVGTEHLKIEKMQRHRLMTVITVIVLPIATSMIYDLIKFAF